jgi:hypothetical protein
MSYPFEHYEEDGKPHVTRREGDHRCDFCLALIDYATVWTYPCAPMPIVGPAGRVIQATDDDWAVCPDCHALIQGSKIGALVERAVTQQPINEPPNTLIRYGPVPMRRRWMRENVLRFMDARTGPPWNGPPWKRPADSAPGS